MAITQNGRLAIDDNDKPVMGGTSSADNATIVNSAFDPVTRRLLVDIPSNGTVTSVSVVSANGLAGTVATPTTTPAITLSTTVNGMVKGNGTALSAATAGTDYSAGTSALATGILKSTTTTGALSIAAAGTDYQAPITLTTTGTSGAATFVGNTLNIPNYATGGSPGGSNTQLQYNNSGVFGGISGATTNGTIVTFASGDLALSGATSGTITLNASAIAGTNTVTLPAATDTLVGKATTDTLTNKTYDTAGTGNSFKINGTAITGVVGSGSVVLASAAPTTTPTASTIAEWDANKNFSANNFIEGFATTATAAGTTTLTVTSAYTQVFTGTTTQTVLLPTTGVAQGAQYLIVNQSTGAVTVQSSGANTIVILAAGTSAVFTAVVATPTTAANWNAQYLGLSTASGKVLTANNSLTLSGTDGKTLALTNGLTVNGNDGTLAFGAASKTFTVNKSLTLDGTDSTTMTFPTTSATLARTDAGQTFTGTQVMTSPKILTSILDTNGNAEISMTATTSAVNGLQLTNAATGNAPTLSVGGASSDSNIGLIVQAKGTGSINLNSGSYNTIQTYTPGAGGTATLDLSKGNIHHITMPAGNITIAISNGSAGQCFIVRILQDGTGSRTVTWFTTIKWAGGSAPTLTTTASKADTLGFEVTTAGSAYDGYVVGQNI